jgi:hypothetical protein
LSYRLPLTVIVGIGWAIDGSRTLEIRDLQQTATPVAFAYETEPREQVLLSASELVGL